MKQESAEIVEIDGWVMRQRRPPGPGLHPVFLLLHGWTGDEDAMWVFAPRLPKDAFLIAPRGLYTTPLGGYGWHPHEAKAWPWVDDFRPALEALLEVLNTGHFPGADFSRPLCLAGFSQGAALAFTFALYYPQFVSRMAGLSGFLPDGALALARNQPLQGKTIFMAHGTQDELVPVARAREAADILRQAGAQVNYCEDDVGHKLSADCFKGMEAFFEAAA